VLRDVKRVIRDHRTFLITSHLNPDADGIGSSVALAELLLMQEKQVRLCFDSHIPSNLLFLDFHGLFERYSEDRSYDEVEVVIVLDTNRYERIGRVVDLLTDDRVSVCVDHHKMAAPFTDVSAIDEEACSVGAQIYTLFKESGYPLNERAAMGIYASVVSDTGRFSYSSTSRKAHKLADECLKLGVDPETMHDQLYRQVPTEQLELFARVLAQREYHLGGRVLVQTISMGDCLETGANADDVDYMHEFQKTLKEIDCAVILRELEGRVRVSVRANIDWRIDRAMNALGGGGHAKAAGATVEGSLSEVKKRVLEQLSLLSNGA